ncbi:keratin-associated protein 10-12 [Anabrus simplex]|uniref:keratin-associated protein 10-12 n=1 Tax=Anabrus simplex TaxID=316456 RepID=UPI0035A37CB3
MKAVLLLAVLVLCYLLDASQAVCPGGGCGRHELNEECTECYSSCECERQNCNLCQGTDACCQSCCDNRKRCLGPRCNNQCDCRKLSCSSCSINQNECCDACCKCRTTKCNRSCGSSCGSVSCSSCQQSPSPCCNTCCEKTETTTTTTTRRPEPVIQPATCCSPNITLPNITIVINQSPITINFTSPAVNVNNQCGNYSTVQGNGTHVIYVYANSTVCPNRTCCRIPWRRPCIPTRMPPYYYCPPSQPSFQCGAACYNPPTPQPPCYPTQTWPYYQCPTAGCYGYGCYQQQNTGCFPIPQWPYFQCQTEMYPLIGDVSYGSPVYAMQAPPVMSMPPSGGGEPKEGPMGVSVPLPQPNMPPPFPPSGGSFLPPSGGGGYYPIPPQFLRP